MNSEDGVTAETLCILSAHEAEKILKDGCAFEGIVFFTYEAGISRERMEQNLNKVNQYGGMWSLENHVLYKNSLQYIFEQMSMLAPVLIGNLSLSWNGTCGQVVFDSEKLWYPDKDGTLHICNYDLKEEGIRKLSGCKRIAYDVQADFVYGVSETGSIVKADSEGNIDELCRPEGFAVREIVPAGTELIWKGLTETDEKSPVWGTVSLAGGEETHQIRTDGGAVIADADGYDPDNVSGKIVVRKNGTETVITPKHSVESGNVFVSSDGSLIVTEYLIYVPDEENPLTPGAQASAADMLCAYSADGTLLFEVMAGSCSIADIEMEPNIPFLHARGDIDRMMICPELQKIWIMRRGNLFAFSYDAASLKEMGATIPS